MCQVCGQVFIYYGVISVQGRGRLDQLLFEGTWEPGLEALMMSIVVLDDCD